MAVFDCDTPEDLARGMSGKSIKEAFEYMFDHDGVTECGDSYLSNGCRVQADGCNHCEFEGVDGTPPPSDKRGFGGSGA